MHASGNRNWRKKKDCSSARLRSAIRPRRLARPHDVFNEPMSHGTWHMINCFSQAPHRHTPSLPTREHTTPAEKSAVQCWPAAPLPPKRTSAVGNKSQLINIRHRAAPPPSAPPHGRKQRRALQRLPSNFLVSPSPGQSLTPRLKRLFLAQI